MRGALAGEVTILLRNFQPGDNSTVSRLMELIYPELKKLARGQFRTESPDTCCNLLPSFMKHTAGS